MFLTSCHGSKWSFKPKRSQIATKNIYFKKLNKFLLQVDHTKYLKARSMFLNVIEIYELMLIPISC